VQQSTWTQQYNTDIVRLPNETRVRTLPPPSDEALISQMRASQQAANKKYAYPRTSSQEYGWNTQPLVPQKAGSEWDAPGLKQSAITKFAHNFIVKQGHSPFINPNSSQQV
jgi:hypothetical protein